jgi:hypothetical protein
LRGGHERSGLGTDKFGIFSKQFLYLENRFTNLTPLSMMKATTPMETSSTLLMSQMATWKSVLNKLLRGRSVMEAVEAPAAGNKLDVICFLVAPFTMSLRRGAMMGPKKEGQATGSAEGGDPLQCAGCSIGGCGLAP